MSEIEVENSNVRKRGKMLENQFLESQVNAEKSPKIVEKSKKPEKPKRLPSNPFATLRQDRLYPDLGPGYQFDQLVRNRTNFDRTNFNRNYEAKKMGRVEIARQPSTQSSFGARRFPAKSCKKDNKEKYLL